MADNRMKDNKDKEISRAIIKRLPRYYRYLGELIDEGVEHISSSGLAHIMGVTASQIRQDLNNFGGFGQQGYGYNVKNLYDEVAKILHIDRIHKIVIVGAGNLGHALAQYANFERRGFDIVALFDRDEKVIGTTVGGKPVYAIDELTKFVNDNEVEIVALTIPKEAAREIAEKLKDTNIKGILNFAHTDLHVSENITVENVHLTDYIMRLCYKMHE
ncbi:MAG: redox-sensing transcriptional repressor Rex [Eubacteriales bacterium]|nr:redox-sensing transcriptional repressor Rex [Eubacteriales bacterium]